MTKPKPRCKSPKCDRPQVNGRNFCRACATNLDRIRKEIEEDPKKLYNQRSDNPHRKLTPGKYTSKKVRRKGVPTCCMVGCFEVRVPPAPYCDAHSSETVYD